MSSKSYRTKDVIGKIGADAFRQLAGSIGLVVNESNDDQAGWDFIVESNPEAANEPYGSSIGHVDSYPIRARIQVKTTAKRDGVINDIKLSNWVRLVESPDPAFFFIAEIDDQNYPQRAWLIHIDNGMWRDVLERKWKNEVSRGKKAGRPLHRLTKRLRYGDHEQLPSLDGQAFLNSLSTVIGPSISDYSATKSIAIQAMGFEQGNVVVKLTAKRTADLPETPQQLLADLEIGIRDSVEFEEVEFYSSRFGISHDEPAQKISEGKLVSSGANPIDKVSLTVRLPEKGRSLRLEGELFVPSHLLQQIRVDDGGPVFNIRISAPPLEIVCPTQVGTASMKITGLPNTPDEVVSVKELHRLAEFILLLHEDESRDSAELEVRSANGSFTLGPGFSVTDMDFQQLIPICNMITEAWTFAKAFDVQDSWRVSLQDLFDGQNLILDLNTAITGKTVNLEATVPAPLRSKGLAEHSETAESYFEARLPRDIIVTESFSMGSHHFIAVLHAAVEPQSRNDGKDTSFYFLAERLESLRLVASPIEEGSIPYPQHLAWTASREVVQGLTLYSFNSIAHSAYAGESNEADMLT